jgi:inorganic pyrophosphatase
MNYPAEYGFIEHTLSDDGDPLDILVISNAPTYPGCVVSARILGYLKMTDNSMGDYKLIAVVDVDPRFNEIQSLSDLPQFRLDEIKDFFANYKKLQNIPVEVEEYHSKEEALEILDYCRRKYKEVEN